jgi:hypothetical protein
VITWDIDLHFPDPKNEKLFGEPFRSCALHRGYGDPVAVPYRCLYARDCPNLFLAGRDISCSHVAFAAVRVQKTLGMLGEVVGMAAGICKEKGCSPRAVYAEHLALLKERMKRGAPSRAQYCAFWGGLHEKYHFPDLGFIPIWPNPATNLTPQTVEAIRATATSIRSSTAPPRPDRGGGSCWRTNRANVSTTGTPPTPRPASSSPASVRCGTSSASAT